MYEPQILILILQGLSYSHFCRRSDTQYLENTQKTFTHISCFLQFHFRFPSVKYCQNSASSYSVLEETTSARAILQFRYESLPSFLPSPFLMCCAILPTSFGGKGPYLRPSSDGFLADVFLSCKGNAKTGS